MLCRRPLNPLELPTGSSDLIPIEKAGLQHTVGAVYGLWSDSGELLYIGQTGDLAARVAQHRRDPKKAEAAAFSFVAVDDPQLRLVTETVEIVRWRPRLNAALLLRVSKGVLSEIRYKRRRGGA